MLSVIDKNLCAVTVQDQAEFDFSVPAVYLASSLMNDRSSGTGEFTVDLQHRFIGTETYCRMILLISWENVLQISYKYPLYFPDEV